MAFEKDVKVENVDDVAEVINYVKALNYGIERLDSFPMSTRLIKELHEILMDGVRGTHKTPGEYKKTQNWIGPAGSTASSTMEVWRYRPGVSNPPKSADTPAYAAVYYRLLKQGMTNSLTQLTNQGRLELRPGIQWNLSEGFIHSCYSRLVLRGHSKSNSLTRQPRECDSR